MSTLSDFLLSHPVDSLEEDVILSPRLGAYPFTIKGVSSKAMAEYTASCRKKNQREVVFDHEKFNLLLILNHCVQPDFRSLDLLEKAKCQTPEELVNRTLKAGEINNLAKAIYNLSGYGETLEDLKEQVKN